MILDGRPLPRVNRTIRGIDKVSPLSTSATETRGKFLTAGAGGNCVDTCLGDLVVGLVAGYQIRMCTMKEWRQEETLGVHMNQSVILSKKWGPPLCITRLFALGFSI